MEKPDKSNKDRTQREQKYVENMIKKIFDKEGFDINNPEEYDHDKEFNIEAHLNYAKNMIFDMHPAYGSMDSGRPWFAYWVLNIIDTCTKHSYKMSHEFKLKFVPYLKELQHPDGGFMGFNKGHAHVVSNYAAVMAIMALNIKEAYDIIDKDKMRSFLKRMKNNDPKETRVDSKGNFTISGGDKMTNYKANWPGSFQMHENGESDLRATYCGLTVAYILNILDDELLEGVIEYIKSCQTFEGGLGPEPFCEAHGGYSYCGIATLVLLNQLEQIDITRFLIWLTNRQMTVEGGFQGRTNKLVDSCYSFWQSSIFNMLIMNDKASKYSFESELLYDQLALQAYILFACQFPTGGMVDKPEKRPDLFHTNYASVGLSLSQKCLVAEDIKVSLSLHESLDLEDINPIFCVAEEKVRKAMDYYWGGAVTESTNNNDNNNSNHVNQDSIKNEISEKIETVNLNKK